MIFLKELFFYLRIMPHKLFPILLIVLSFYACGNKSAEHPRALDESIDLLVSNISDSTLSYEEYQPIFEEILDSLQDVVLANPDAELRFAARKVPTIMLSYF